MGKIINWLLEGPAWLQYRTRVDLLHQPVTDPQLISLHQEMLGDPQVQALLSELSTWPGEVLKNHKSAGHLYHKLNFLVDIGIQADDPGIARVIDSVLEHQSPEGPFQSLLNIPVHFGGSGKDSWSWMLCDAPNLVYAMLKLGLGTDPRVQRAVDYLLQLVRSNGWPCTTSPDLGKFHGPGRRDDPCPYANLIMLKVLGQIPEVYASSPAQTGVEAVLTLWEQRRDQHPYLFHMGTDFCKLKVPFVWYDLVHVLEVLSHFPWLPGETRYQEMVNMLKSKANPLGQYTPESAWSAWKDWEFGQKKAPSRWLTFIALRILQKTSSR